MPSTARTAPFTELAVAGAVAMAAVLITINDARAVFTGTVPSAAAKAKAEQLVKSIRGVKAVDNKIEVSG